MADLWGSLERAGFELLEDIGDSECDEPGEHRTLVLRMRYAPSKAVVETLRRYVVDHARHAGVLGVRATIRGSLLFVHLRGTEVEHRRNRAPDGPAQQRLRRRPPP